MKKHANRPHAELVALATDEMSQVLGGAQVDYFLKLKGIDGEATTSGGIVSDDVIVDGKIITG